jgi:Redoxin.
MDKKRIILAAVAVCGYLFSHAQFDLKGHIKNLPAGETVMVNAPLVFGYFDDMKTPLTTDEDGNFSVTLPLDEEKIGYLRWGDRQAFLWMRPGIDLTVELDGSNGQIAFGGEMGGTNKLLHELELWKAPLFFTDSKRVAANEMQDRVIQPYMQQLAAKMAKVDASTLTPREKEFLKAELHYHFIGYVDLYVRTARWPRKEWSNFIIEFMQGETPRPRSALLGPMYYQFVDAYAFFLASRALSSRDNPVKFAQSLDSTYGISSFDSLLVVAREHGETFLNWMAVKRAFDANTTERYLAQQVKEKYDDGEVSTGNRLFEALELHNRNSTYLDTLTSIRASLMKRMATVNNDIIIPDDYRTFQQVKTFVKQFQGKVVYLDIWGTWCGPCKEEMRYLPTIKAQLEGKDIVFLYLDMDDDEKDHKWREYIQANAITGVHLRKNNEDIQAIWKELLPDDDARHGRYPTYFIFDKHGNLVADEIKRPSDGKDLVKQLEEYL